MATYTSAYSQFITRIREIDTIRSVARGIEREGSTSFNLEATRGLCRGGIVLLCGHIEGYIEDLAILGLNGLADNNISKEKVAIVFRYYLSQDLISEITDTKDHQALSEKIDGFIKRDGHIWDSSPNFSHPVQVDKFVGRFSTPTHENIRAFFRRFGFTSFHGDLATRLKGNMPVCTNMVEQVVIQRNRIAHGDFSEYGTPADLEQMCKYVRLYCRHTDLVVGNWFKSIGCSIRS